MNSPKVIVKIMQHRNESFTIVHQKIEFVSYFAICLPENWKKRSRERSYSILENRFSSTDLMNDDLSPEGRDIDLSAARSASLVIARPINRRTPATWKRSFLAKARKPRLPLIASRERRDLTIMACSAHVRERARGHIPAEVLPASPSSRREGCPRNDATSCRRPRRGWQSLSLLTSNGLLISQRLEIIAIRRAFWRAARRWSSCGIILKRVRTGPV